VMVAVGVAVAASCPAGAASLESAVQPMTAAVNRAARNHENERECKRMAG